jgi:hypothetical protein
MKNEKLQQLLQIIANNLYLESKELEKQLQAGPKYLNRFSADAFSYLVGVLTIVYRMKAIDICRTLKVYSQFAGYSLNRLVKKLMYSELHMARFKKTLQDVYEEEGIDTVNVQAQIEKFLAERMARRRGGTRTKSSVLQSENGDNLLQEDLQAVVQQSDRQMQGNCKTECTA